MKISINLSVEIDPETWSLEYGVEGNSAIRADIREHVSNGVQDHFRDILGEDAVTVTLR